jgi:hypothetical protein
MDFALDRYVFCHDLINPPTQSRQCFVHLYLVKSSDLFDIKKENSESSETAYSVHIPNGHNLGFTTSEQGELEKEFYNLILAFNLNVDRACLTSKQGEFFSEKVTPKPSEPKASVTKSDGGYHIESEETVVVREETKTGLGISAVIEEIKIVETFRKIQQLRRFERKSASQLRALNLNTALSKYENGIAEYEPVIKFKHLFSSLEDVINLNGTKTGGAFDSEVQRIVSVSNTIATEWRVL